MSDEGIKAAMDEMIYGIGVMRQNADGSVERIDPKEVWMSDLLKRLRSPSLEIGQLSPLMYEAAAEIERLKRELEQERHDHQISMDGREDLANKKPRHRSAGESSTGEKQSGRENG